MDFYNEMEQSLVNGELPHSKYGRPQNLMETQKDFDEFCDKKYKADYLSL